MAFDWKEKENQHSPFQCEKAIGRGFLISGYRQDGEKKICPGCGRVWIHSCDEAEGCSWFSDWEDGKK